MLSLLFVGVSTAVVSLAPSAIAAWSIAGALAGPALVELVSVIRGRLR